MQVACNPSAIELGSGFWVLSEIQITVVCVSSCCSFWLSCYRLSTAQVRRIGRGLAMMDLDALVVRQLEIARASNEALQVIKTLLEIDWCNPRALDSPAKVRRRIANSSNETT